MVEHRWFHVIASLSILPGRVTAPVVEGALGTRHLLLAGLLLGITACGGSEPTSPPDNPSPIATTVTLSATTVSFASLSDTEQLTAMVRDQFGATMPVTTVTWNSSDPQVARVTEGLVTATGNGTALVSARAGAAADTAVVTVLQVATRILVTPDTATLAIGDTLRLQAALFDANGDSIRGRTVSWVSADTAIVSVDDGGLVTARFRGTSWVHAVSESISDSARIAVSSNSLRVFPDLDTLTTGADTIRFTATVIDSNGSTVQDPEVMWSSTDTLIARHVSSGAFVGVGVGTAGIVASYLATADTAALVVDVEITSIFIAQGSEEGCSCTNSLSGSRHQLMLMGRGTVGSFFLFDGQWGSSDPIVATVDSTGLVTAGVEGTANITAIRAGLVAPPWVVTVTTPSDFYEELISRSFSSWWTSGHRNTVAITMSTMADEHTSSWGNFAMREMSSEPRIAYNNDPSASYAYVTLNTWRDSYTALSDVRDGLIAIQDTGVEIGEGGQDTPRVHAFAKLVQGLSLGTLAMTFDQAFVVTERTDYAAEQMSGYETVMTASLASLDEAIALADANVFTVPSAWVGDGGSWSNTRMAQIAHAYKARFMVSRPRTPAERSAVDWIAVTAEVDAGHTEDFNTVHDDVNWAWDRLKVHAGANDVWARVDLQMLGPADQSGAFQVWSSSHVESRTPFLIDTDDLRLTNGDPVTDGIYIRYVAEHRFRPERGTYHLSNYSDNRWYPVRLNNYVGTNGEFPVKELDFIRAEALFRTGDLQGAANIVNQYRVANGGLPPVTTAGDQTARCVPRHATTGACTDLWEALKYDKRMEVWHYGAGTAFFDDRGWGDLVERTPLHFPVPGQVLADLGLLIYTFGGDQPPMARASGRVRAPEELLIRYWDEFRKRMESEKQERSRASPRDPAAR